MDPDAMTDRDQFIDMMLRKLIRKTCDEIMESNPSYQESDEASQRFWQFAHDIDECDLLEQRGVREKWLAFIGELLADGELIAAADAAMEAGRISNEKHSVLLVLLKKALSAKRLPFPEERKELMP